MAVATPADGRRPSRCSAGAVERPGDCTPAQARTDRACFSDTPASTSHRLSHSNAPQPEPLLRSTCALCHSVEMETTPTEAAVFINDTRSRPASAHGESPPADDHSSEAAPRSLRRAAAPLLGRSRRYRRSSPSSSSRARDDAAGVQRLRAATAQARSRDLDREHSSGGAGGADGPARPDATPSPGVRRHRHGPAGLPALAMEEIPASARRRASSERQQSLYCDPVLKFGTEEQKRRWLTRLLAARSSAATLSSLATARTSTTARLDGDEWVINGRRRGSPCARRARRDRHRHHRQEPKHKGLSAFIVPTDSPGPSARRRTSWASARRRRAT